MTVRGPMEELLTEDYSLFESMGLRDDLLLVEGGPLDEQGLVVLVFA